MVGNKVLKVIIETCYLTDDEKKMATLLVVNAGADFVKTSTGFGTGGATLEDIELIKSVTQKGILNEKRLQTNRNRKDRKSVV